MPETNGMRERQYRGSGSVRCRNRLLGSSSVALVGVALGVTPLAAWAASDGAGRDGVLSEIAQSSNVDAQAQSGPQPQQAAEDEAIEQIVITGSRIARTGLFASTPVASVDRTDFKLSGTVNPEELLNSLPQFIPGSTASSNIPGTGVATVDLRGLGPTRTLVLVNGRRYIFFDANQITDINTIPAALIERTEVVTGGSSAVYGSDAIAGVVNFILRDDFEGIELQTQQTLDSRGDGLTSDFNITMGGNFADGRGNAVVSVNYFKREPIRNSDRDFAKFALVDRLDEDGNPVLLPGGSADIPAGRFFGIPTGDALNVSGREGLRSALNAAGLANLTGRGFVPDPTGMTAAPFRDPEDRFNYAPFNFLQIPQERWGITSMTHYDIHENITAYVEAAFSNNRVARQQSPTPVRGNFLFEVDNPFLGPELQEVLRQLDLQEGRVVDGAVVSTNPDGSPFTTRVTNGTAAETTTPGDGLAVLAVGRRLIEITERPIFDERNAWRTVFGLRGKLGNASDDFLRNMSYDVYYSFARTENTQRKGGLVSLSAFFEGVRSGSGGPNGTPILNPFGPNISEEGAEFISRNITNIEISELQVAAGTLTGDLFDMPELAGTSPGTVSFSVGGEWRSTSGSFTPDELLSSGDIAGATAGQPTSGEVDVWELFAEVRVPLLADLPLVENLTANGAFRYSNYDLDGVNSVWTYLGGFDWRLSEDIAFRGQFQRAIRAPNINELFAGQFQIFRPATDPCAQAGAATDPVVRELCIQTGVPEFRVGDPSVQPNVQVEGLAGGNPDLEAERSDTYTLGGVITPSWLPGFSLTIDYFDVKVAGAVGIAGGGVNSALDLCFNTIQDINSDVCQLISRNPLTGVIQSPFFVNALSANTGKLKSEGIDAQIGYHWDVGFGLLSDVSSFDFKFAGTWTDKFTITPLLALPEQKNFCVGTFGSTCGEPRPEFKTTARLTWNTGPLSLSARHRFIDAVKDDRVILPLRRGEVGADPAKLVNPRFKPQHYIDLSFTYDVIENLSLYGGVNNITDNKPPLQGANVEQGNTFPDTFDTIGTEFFLGATVRF